MEAGSADEEKHQPGRSTRRATATWSSRSLGVAEAHLARAGGGPRPGATANLVVAATGTGKTLVAAFDYEQLQRRGQVESLLFVAHRKEILEQSRRVFRHVLRREHFGELWVDGQVPETGRHVFASIPASRG